MIRRICPEDPELLPLASGEPADGEVADHVTGCPACRERVDRMAAEVRSLRRNQAAVLTEPWPEPGLSWGTPGALAHGATEDWTPPDPTLTLAPEPAAAAGVHPVAPAAIGKYLVVGELDRGGQAVVYRVVHAGLGRELALKYARNPLAGGDAARGLIAEEARALAAVPDHPGLVRVHDMDLHEGHLYMVMDFVRGRTLAQFARDHRPGPRQAAALVAEVARAVEVAHRCGLVHQAIKPKNVLVDERGGARLIDFGLARLRHAWADVAVDDGPSGGTPEFMAPEQARDEAEQVGPRSDVFALGAALYSLLTGRPPFAGGDGSEALARARRGGVGPRGPRPPRRPPPPARGARPAAPAARGAGAAPGAGPPPPAPRSPRAGARPAAGGPSPRRPGGVAGRAGALLLAATAGGAWALGPSPRPGPGPAARGAAAPPA